MGMFTWFEIPEKFLPQEVFDYLPAGRYDWQTKSAVVPTMSTLRVREYDRRLVEEFHCLRGADRKKVFPLEQELVFTGTIRFYTGSKDAWRLVECDAEFVGGFLASVEYIPEELE